MKQLCLLSVLCLLLAACPSGQSGQQQNDQAPKETKISGGHEGSIWDTRNFIEGAWSSIIEGEEVRLHSNNQTREQIDMTLEVNSGGNQREFLLTGSAKSITQGTARVFTTENKELELSYELTYNDAGDGISLKATDFKQARTHGLPQEIMLKHVSEGLH